VSEREWVQVHIIASPEQEEAFTNFCHEHGSTGIVLEELGSRIHITAYLEKDKSAFFREDFQQYANALQELFPDLLEATMEMSPLKNENWAVLWQENFKPLHIGERLLVTPPWISPDPGNWFPIIIEPAEAFGTGTHETTQSCLVLLEKSIEDLKRDSQKLSLLDIGCGSGILAIAAVKLGVSEVRAVDSDEIAVRSAKKNAVLNGVESELLLETCSLKDVVLPAVIVTANLDSKTLTNHKDDLVRLFQEHLIVSGVPTNEWEGIKEMFFTAGLQLHEEVTRAEWGAGTFRRNTRES
jgi:ribosomal protein L11 methyltransferase